MFDLVIENANVLTMDGSLPQTTAFAVTSGRIAAVGSEVSEAPARRTINARGLTVTPGFNDAHCHTAWFGLSLDDVDLSAANSLDTVYSAIASRAAHTQPGEWVVAAGFNHHQCDGQFPDLSRLDAAAPENPVFIRHNSGHACVVNSTALQRAGIGAGSMEAGVVLDGALNPTGVLEETAQEKVQALFLPYALQRIVAAIDAATGVYASQGITSFTEAGIGGGWIGHSGIEAAAYQQARREGKLHARAQLMVALDVLHLVSSHPSDAFGIGLDLGLHTGFGDDWLALGPAKVFLDGSLFAETAAMTESYCSHEHKLGYLQTDEATLRQRILDACASGWSIAAHAIGDRAIDLALDILGQAATTFGAPAVPNRIEHGAVIRPDQLQRLAEQKLVVVPQASFFQKFGGSMIRSLGSERSMWAYRAKSLLDAGLILPGSSDRPVVDGSPLRGMQAFVDRAIDGGRMLAPDERLSVSQAIHAYTMGSAEATGAGANKGSITAGKLADFVFLDGNPLTLGNAPLDSLTPLATLVGGEFSYGEI